MTSLFANSSESDLSRHPRISPVPYRRQSCSPWHRNSTSFPCTRMWLRPFSPPPPCHKLDLSPWFCPPSLTVLVMSSRTNSFLPSRQAGDFLHHAALLITSCSPLAFTEYFSNGFGGGPAMFLPFRSKCPL